MPRQALLTAVALFAALLLAGLAIALHWRPVVPVLPTVRPLAGEVEPSGSLNAQFFGTSTLLISDGSTRLMCDGFFSRPGWLSLLALPLAPDHARIQAALAQGGISKLDALFVAHSHHDHALDAGEVARRTGAVLIGSESTHRIAQGAGLGAERMRVIQAGQALVLGAFELTAIETPHSPEPVFPGLVGEAFQFPARLAQFKDAQNYSFFLRHPRGNVLIVPSANYRPGAFAGLKADTVFLGIGGLGKQSDEFVRTYWHETVVVTGATRVIPVHWDDFGLGLAQALQPMPYALDRLDVSLAKLQALAVSQAVELQMPSAFQRFHLH